MMSVSSSSPFLKFKFKRSQKSFTKRLHSVLDRCLERFECHKEDEYHFSSPEFVEGIPPFACEFASQPHNNHLLAAADEDGRVVIYDTNRAQQNSVVKEWSAHKNAIFDIAWSSSDPPRLLTASGDQSAALWDVHTATRLGSFKQHRCSLKSVSFRPRDGHVFATGARDGSIMLWDDRSKKRSKDSSRLSVGVINEAHVNPLKKAQPKRRKKLAPDLPTIDSSNSVSVVLFQKEDTLLSAGATDGIVKMWDLRMLKSTKASSSAPFHQFPYAGTSNRRRGFSSLALSSNRTQLFASCTDSAIYEYDLSGVLGTQPISSYCGHMNSTFFVRAAVSPDDLFLLSGSSDNRAYIWKIGQPESPPVTLVGHEAEVTAVAWCPQDFTKVVTCSDDNTMRIWKMASNETQISDGQRSVIGKAERCQREVSLNGQGHSEQPSSNSSSRQSSQSFPSSVSKTSASASLEKTGGQTSSHPSPVPSSTKKRKFSLRDWATTSPSPSRGPSPSSPSKRTRSASTPSSSEPGVSGEEATVGSGRKRNCDSGSTSVGAGKRVKVSTGEGSPQIGLTAQSVLCKRDESASNDESENVKGKGNLKLNNGATSTEAGIAAAEEKHICVDNELNKENTAVCGKKSSPEKKSTSQSKTLSAESINSTASSKKATPGQRSPLKDDIPMNRASRLVTQPNQTTGKTNQIISKPAKKNLSSYFSMSPKPAPTDEQCYATAEELTKETKQHELEDDSKDRVGMRMQKNLLETSLKGMETQQNVEKSVKDKETKQQSPGKCLKNKRVAKLHKAVKRRNNSAGTIEGYFSPVVKRHKSET